MGKAHLTFAKLALFCLALMLSTVHCVQYCHSWAESSQNEVSGQTYMLKALQMLL